MEVENMDMQEMVDVTAPLLEQKELEAEALRLQIQLRDRVIEEQDELLQAELQAALSKPEAWISVPAAKPSWRKADSVRWLEEDDQLGLASVPEEQSPSRRRGYSVVGGQKDPEVGISGRGRAASEGPPQTLRGKLPPISPSESRLRPDLPPEQALRPDRSRGGLHAGSPNESASGSASALENFEAPHRGRALDVAGHGLGLPPRPSAEHREARRTPKGEDSEGDLDTTRMPYAQSPPGYNGLTPEASRRPVGLPTSATRKRDHRKKTREIDSEHRPQVQLQVEASGFRRELEDSQGSGSEVETGHGKSPSPQPREKVDPGLAPTPVSAAIERRGIISKLNKRMKSGQENAPAGKHLY